MTGYDKLVKALRIHASVDIECYECAYYDDCCINGNGHTKMMTDAAAAIEDMAKHITEMHERVTVLQIARGELEAEVERLKADVDAAYRH